MSATCLRAYISDNINGPFAELVDCFYTPCDYEQCHEFMAYENARFKEAWNGVLKGEPVAHAYFLFTVGDTSMRFKKRIYPLVCRDGIIHAAAQDEIVIR